MELDAGHLGAGEQPPDVDVVDGVAGDGAEGGAQAADDARLLAVGDVLLRTTWWPMFSLDQPFFRARSMVLT